MNQFKALMLLVFLLTTNAACSQVSEEVFPTYAMENTEVRELPSRINGIKYQLYISFPAEPGKGRSEGEGEFIFIYGRHLWKSY